MGPQTPVAMDQTPRVGLEPTTARLTAACSTDWAIEEYQRTTRVLYNTNFILSRIFANFPNFFPVRQLPYCIKNSFISLGLPDSLLGSAWPAMYQEFSVPVSYAGGISMIIAAGTILSSLQSDHLTTNFGTGKVTAFSVLMTAVALFGFSVSHSYIALCLWVSYTDIPLKFNGPVHTPLVNSMVIVWFLPKTTKFPPQNRQKIEKNHWFRQYNKNKDISKNNFLEKPLF